MDRNGQRQENLPRPSRNGGGVQAASSRAPLARPSFQAVQPLARMSGAYSPGALFRIFGNRYGFTLIEMAMVVVIVGILVSVVASVMPSLLRSSKVKQGQAILEKIDYSLQGYSMANHRLPYADSGTDGTEDPGVYVGYVPYRTLGLSTGKDVWGNPISYGVFDTLTTTNSSNFCTVINSITSYTDGSKIHITDEDTGNITNQAFIVVSGGPKDLDDDRSDGFFDGLNEGDSVQFDDPYRIEFHGSPRGRRYDDLMRSLSLAELSQKNCTSNQSGDTGGGGEDTYTDGCTNGVDDDGDTFIDCDDQDCFDVGGCTTGGDDVRITTTTIPSGVLSSDYTATLQATGGTVPYEWSLTGNGGFTDFFLHTYTGQLSGTLTQCPGTYTVSVEVEDSTSAGDGGPKTDSKSFDLTVTTNLTVSLTSGSSTDIEWQSATQQETFSASGGNLGDINWTLDTGGATGFSVSSTGPDTCVMKKIGATTAATYTFTLTATDASCASNTADLIMAVTITGSGTGSPGAASGPIDDLEFDTSNGRIPSMVRVAGDTFAIAYQGPGNDGFVKTVDIADDGQIANAVTDTLEFDTANGLEPTMVHVTGDIFAVAYRGSGSDGFLKTVQISAAGDITNSVVDTLEFDTANGGTPDIVQISQTIYAIAYRGSGNDGFVRTVEIASDGQITDAVVDSLEFDTAACYEPSIILVAGEYYAIAYRGPGNDGFVRTVQIASDGQIANAVVDSLEFDPSYCVTPDILQLASDLYGIAYRGPGNDGFLKTVTITGDGQIGSVVDTLEFDTSNGYEPDLNPIGGDVYAVAYAGSGLDGFIKTIEIETSGAITDTVIDTLEFDTSNGRYPDMLLVGGDVFAIAYQGPGNDGFLRTVNIVR